MWGQPPSAVHRAKLDPVRRQSVSIRKNTLSFRPATEGSGRRNLLFRAHPRTHPRKAPAGAVENSPALQRWESQTKQQPKSPKGTAGSPTSRFFCETWEANLEYRLQFRYATAPRILVIPARERSEQGGIPNTIRQATAQIKIPHTHSHSRTPPHTRKHELSFASSLGCISAFSN
jgi:hypothetical protein